MLRGQNNRLWLALSAVIWLCEIHGMAVRFRQNQESGSWFMVSVRVSHGCTQEVAKDDRSARVARRGSRARLECLVTNYRFITSTLFVSNFSFPKPIESLQLCISMHSMRHQHAYVTLWNTLWRRTVSRGSWSGFPIPFPNPYFFQIPLPSAQIQFWSRLKGFKNIYPTPILTFFPHSQCPKSHFPRATEGQSQLPFYPFSTH